MRYYIPLLLSVAVSLSSCNHDKDAKGRLFLDKLESSSGTVKFAPMSRTVAPSKFKPDTFTYKGVPYTGQVAKYNENDTLMMEGTLDKGIANGTWTFYYASGGVQAKGEYKNGLDVGIWRSYYGYDKVRTEKHYDETGLMRLRIDYYDNGKVKSWENIHSPEFQDKERLIRYDRGGNITSIYVEDSIHWEEGK